MAELGDVEVQRTGQRALEVFQAFEKVGPPITHHAEAVLFRAGVLTLRVSGSPWLNGVLWLAEAGFTTGALIDIDGGV